MGIDIIANGRIATMRKARKGYECAECGRPIECGENHYCVTYAESGRGGLDRVHEHCVDKYLKGNRTRGG